MLTDKLFAVLRTELELRQLTEEFETARGEWLELSDTTESYVVFDPQDRLVAWNKRYTELLQIPSELLHRGTPRADLIKRARQGGRRYERQCAIRSLATATHRP